MATKEITKRESQYSERDLEPQLIPAPQEETREKIVGRLALLWDSRSFIFRCTALSFAGSVILALIAPVRYTSITRLMPPDQGGQGMASMLAAVAKATGDSALGGISGIKTS